MAVLCVASTGGALLHAQTPAASAGANAETAFIRGAVADSSGRFVPDATVKVTPVGPSAVTDSLGRFSLKIVAGEHRIVVQKIGYSPDWQIVTVRAGDTVKVDFEISKAVQSLTRIEVRDSGLIPARYRFTTRFDDFFRHRATSAGGRFFDRDEIDRYGGVARALSSLSGIRAQETMSNLQVRFTRCEAPSSPALIVDGVVSKFDVLTTIPITSIELVEVYRSVAELPIEARGNACGALVIYTR